MNNMEKYFSKAKNIDYASQPFSNAELRSLLEKSSGSHTNDKTTHFSKLKRRIIMTSVASIVVAVVLSLVTFMSTNNSTLNIKPVKTNQVVEKNTKYPAMASDKPLMKPENEPGKNTEVKTGNAINSADSEQSIDILTAIAPIISKAEVMPIILNKRFNHPVLAFDSKDIASLQSQEETPSNELQKVVVLDDKELEKLGIARTADGYTIIVESMFEAKKPDVLKANGYDIDLDNGIVRMKHVFSESDRSYKEDEIIPYNGWKANQPTPTCPIEENRFFKNGSNSSLGTCSFGYPPLMNHDPYCYRQLDAVFKVFYKNQDWNAYNLDLVLRNEEDHPKPSKLVPVYFILKGGTNVILWYVPTSKFLALLPDRYKGRYTPDDSYMENWNMPPEPPTKEDIATFPNHGKSNIIPKMKMLDLSKDELKKLGIDFNGVSCSYISEEKYDLSDASPRAKFYLDSIGYDTTKRTIVRKTVVTVDTGDIHDKTLPYGGWNNDRISLLQPVSVSSSGFSFYKESAFVYDSINKKRYIDTIYKRSSRIMVSDAENPDLIKDKISEANIFDLHAKLVNYNDATDDIEWNPVVEKLVPVHFLIGIRDDPDSSKINYSDIILWYYPTEDFLNAIPKQYSDQIRKELSILDNVAEGKMPYEEACKGLENTESFFGICRLSSGSLKALIVYPAPVRNKATCQYFLDSERKVTISLYDVNGNFIRNLVENKSQKPGNQEVPFEVGGVSQGAYLVAVTTDKGEQVVQRIIVQ